MLEVSISTFSSCSTRSPPATPQAGLWIARRRCCSVLSQQRRLRIVCGEASVVLADARLAPCGAALCSDRVPGGLPAAGRQMYANEFGVAWSSRSCHFNEAGRKPHGALQRLALRRRTRFRAREVRSPYYCRRRPPIWLLSLEWTGGCGALRRLAPRGPRGPGARTTVNLLATRAPGECCLRRVEVSVRYTLS